MEAISPRRPRLPAHAHTMRSVVAAMHQLRSFELLKRPLQRKAMLLRTLLLLSCASTVLSVSLDDIARPWVLPKGGALCDTDLDCQLNGICLSGLCKCDAAWTSTNCSVLHTLPARKTNVGYNHMASPWSSWGGSVVLDPDTNTYYLGVSGHPTLP